MNIKDTLIEILGNENVKTGETMKDHITFEVGGPADYYVTPESPETLARTLGLLQENDIPYYIIGKGSNLLVTDKGFRGVIIELLKLDKIETNGNVIRAQAGATLKDVAEQALQEGLTGYEFASGIPGTIGGAIRMNAGAYDGEHKMVVEEITVLDGNGNLRTLDNEACHFGYRHSVIQEEPYVVVDATLRLTPGNKEAIRERMAELKDKRESSQPLEYPSAGSTFRRPEGYFVGPMLTDLGLKGKRVGGAQVSEKHAGFVINRDHATARDIQDLIALIKDRVRSEVGIEIKEEVILIGE